MLRHEPLRLVGALARPALERRVHQRRYPARLPAFAGTGARSARLQGEYKHAASIVGMPDTAATARERAGDHPHSGDQAAVGAGVLLRFDGAALPALTMPPALFGAIPDHRRDGTFHGRAPAQLAIPVGHLRHGRRHHGSGS